MNSWSAKVNYSLLMLASQWRDLGVNFADKFLIGAGWILKI